MRIAEPRSSLVLKPTSTEQRRYRFLLNGNTSVGVGSYTWRTIKKNRTTYAKRNKNVQKECICSLLSQTVFFYCGHYTNAYMSGV